MEHLVIAPPPGSFGALLRTCRHRACLSQERLAARAEVSERTVRNLEADRVRSPHNDTVRLLADALQLGGRERGNWFAAARGVNHLRAGLAAPGPGGPAPLPGGGLAQLPPGADGPGLGAGPARRRAPAGEFQATIAALGQRDDRLIAQAASDVDPDETPVRARASRAEAGAGSRGDSRLTRVDRRELAELRRETRRLREDVEILKQAAAIFAAATR